MSRHAAARTSARGHARTARSTHAARTGRAAAPRSPRRVSGPMRPVGVPAPAGRAAVRRPAAAPARAPRLSLGALPDHRLLDTLLRSRAWIWLIGIALGGIVAMQVSLLKLNAGISRAVESTATLERQNARLETQIAHLASGERIRLAAQEAGMVMPDAGRIRYLTVRPQTDALRALRRMQPPSEEAIALMRNRGLAPGAALPVVADPLAVAAEPVLADPAALPAGTPAAAPAAPVTDPTAAAPVTATAGQG